MSKDPTEATIDPPEDMPGPVADVWHEIVATNDFAGRVDRAALETFATLVARLREARQRIADEGMVVTDTRGRVIPHPALAVERETANQIRIWGDRFAPLVKPARKRGYMADATAASIAAASHLKAPKYAGPVALLKTTAWLIDEAQRDSMEALQRTAATLIPLYLKSCAELQITPASVPGTVQQAPAAEDPPAAAAGGAAKAGGGSVTDMQERARARRGAG
ncbi:P27 family phage terminase small subunit [Arthrobacter sp. TmT3-37]